MGVRPMDQQRTTSKPMEARLYAWNDLGTPKTHAQEECRAVT